MSLKDKINLETLPQHIAIIMDGNGRWAKLQGASRSFGHENGIRAIQTVVEAASKIGIRYLTLYTFSIENWNRPKEEIDFLMNLLSSFIQNETKKLNENNVKLITIGNLQSLPPNCYKEMQEAIESTKNNTGMTLVMALSYSSRWEITKAVKEIAEKIENKTLSVSEIDESTISSHLCTANIPDPELMIRTSGENRISNFLLWQLAYTELYFTEKLWPDFGNEELFEAILNYQNRERRFGKTSEQIV